MTAPTVVHEDRVTMLRTIAALTGCATNVSHLPDGTTPDLLAVDIPGLRWMIGDAKATEDPACRATQVRIAHYLRWGQAMTDEGADVMFMLAACALDAGRWMATLRMLTGEYTNPPWTVACLGLAGGDVVITVQPSIS